jgi:transposase
MPLGELAELVKAAGNALIDLHGIGPSCAARLLVEVGDITRFPSKGHFASWTGTAPHRRILRRQRPAPALPRRQPADQQGPAHDGRSPIAQRYRRKGVLRPQGRRGQNPNEAMRCLNRRLSDIVYRTMLDDLVTAGTTPSGTGPGGHRGNVSDSSAAGSHPHTSSSDKSLPGPATTKPRTPLRKASWHRREPEADVRNSRRAEIVPRHRSPSDQHASRLPARLLYDKLNT